MLPRLTFPTTAGLLLLILNGCDASERRSASTEPDIAYSKANGVAALALAPLSRVNFSAKGVSPPTQYMKLIVTDDRFYALDGFDPFVKVYSRSGEFLQQIGKEGEGPGELERPLTFGLNGDEVWIVDVGRGRGVSRFTREGAYLSEASLKAGSPIFDLNFIGDGPAVAVLGRAREKDGWQFARVFNRAGKEELRGCSRDGSVIRSLAEEGRLSMTPVTRLAVGGDIVYCIQQTSPVVQMLSLSGRTLEPFRLSPPFYRPPSEGELSLNAKRMFEYMSTWTSHDAIYALTDGFASVYSTYDLESAAPRYAVFACRSVTTKPMCGVVENLPQPAFIAPDGTVYLDHGEDETEDQTSLGVYRLEGWEAA